MIHTCKRLRSGLRLGSCETKQTLFKFHLSGSLDHSIQCAGVPCYSCEGYYSLDGYVQVLHQVFMSAEALIHR